MRYIDPLGLYAGDTLICPNCSVADEEVSIVEVSGVPETQPLWDIDFIPVAKAPASEADAAVMPNVLFLSYTERTLS